jgi:hypothetical protein
MSENSDEQGKDKITMDLSLLETPFYVHTLKARRINGHTASAALPSRSNLELRDT